jgi:hypothetical protein
LATRGVDGDDVLHDWLPLKTASAASLGRLIASVGFRTSAPKTENGFLARKNCFVAALATKHSNVKRQQFELDGFQRAREFPVSDRKWELTRG